MFVLLAAWTAGAVPSVGATSWVNFFLPPKRVQRSWDLHFVRPSRKPSNLCALLRSHEAMVVVC